MAKRSKRCQDDSRTDLLCQNGIYVQKGLGDDDHFYAWTKDEKEVRCPRCGGKAIKIQDLFSKTYLDIIKEADRSRIVTVIYEFHKYRCLDETCRHIFPRPIKFASRNDNVTYRLEEEIAELVIRDFSYKRISNKFSYSLSKQAIGQIFNRWVSKKEKSRSFNYKPKKLAVITGSLPNEKYTAFLNLDEGIKIYDIIYGVDTLGVISVLSKMKSDNPEEQIIIYDCDPIVKEAVKVVFPLSKHIIPIQFWFKEVSKEFSEYAHEILKWSTVQKKDELILQSPTDLGYDEYTVKRLLEERPSLERAYEDFNKLREIISIRETRWIFQEMIDWLDSLDPDFKAALNVSSLLIELDREEFEAHSNYFEDVPEGMYVNTLALEENLKKHKVFSNESIKAKVIYNNNPKKEVLESWTGIPIMDAIKFLTDMNDNGGTKNEH